MSDLRINIQFKQPESGKHGAKMEFNLPRTTPFEQVKTTNSQMKYLFLSMFNREN